MLNTTKKHYVFDGMQNAKEILFAPPNSDPCFNLFIFYLKFENILLCTYVFKFIYFDLKR